MDEVILTKPADRPYFSGVPGTNVWLIRALNCSLTHQRDARIAKYKAALEKYNEAKKTNRYAYAPYPPQDDSVEWLAEAIAKGMEGKQGVFIATTASFLENYLAGCVLQSLGFRKASRTCVANPYHRESVGTSATDYRAFGHPGLTDNYAFWTHIWYKVTGNLEVTGLLQTTYAPGCHMDLGGCGNYFGLSPSAQRHVYVGMVPAETKIDHPRVRAFAKFDKYKFIHSNYANRHKICDHKHLLSEFDNWRGNV